MKLLIISQYFWPENFRINDLAICLNDKKIEVTILTANPNYPNKEMYKNLKLDSKYYNMEILINKNIKHEKLYRKDNLYNYLMVIDYNIKKIIPYKGSAIFIHLTKSYKQTAGCLAINQTDFLILAKLVSKRCKLKIC